MRIKGWSGLFVALLGANVIALGGAYAQVAPSIERVSIGESGQQVGPNALIASKIRVSFDGDRVLFGSFESLVSDDLNGADDGFVRIRSSQTTERVTLRADGSELSAPPFGLKVADMSSNGRFVVFTSFDDRVVEGDTNGTWDLFVRDVVTGETERVSLTSDGLSPTNNAPYSRATVSDDGNIVAFVSSAEDLVPRDTNRRDDVFVRDRAKGETIKLRAPGTPRWWGGIQPDITPDGRYVVYRAYESVYRADLWTGEYELVSTELDSRPGFDTDDARRPVISANGRFVAYEVAVGPGSLQVLLRDMTQERPVLVSAGPEGQFANGAAGNSSISADGRFIVFASVATDLGPDVGGINGSNIYLFDAIDGSMSLAISDEAGRPIVGAFGVPFISGDGSTVVFASGVSTLVDGDTNEAPDVFAVSLAAERCAGKIVTIAGSGEIMGTDGADVILASAGSDSIYAGGGDDIICSLEGGDVIDAGAGHDVIYAGSGNDVIYAGDGRDVVFAGKGDDIVNAGSGSDRAFGGPGTDIMRGNRGADRLGGGPGDDTLIGGPGNDTLAGGADIDTCRGSAGRDRYFLCEERQP